MAHCDARLWQHRDFLRLWASQSVSLLGLQVGSIAMPLVAILTLRASAAQVGLLASVETLPALAAGLFVGVAVDRVRRRPVLIVAHVGRAACLASVPLAAVLGLLTMSHLYVVAAVNGVLSICFEVAYHSYLPTLISAGALADGNSRFAITDGIARTAGPGIGGIAVQVLTAPATLALQVVTYVAAGLTIWRIRSHEPAPGHRTPERVLRALRAGMAFGWRHRPVRVLASSETTYLFFFAVISTSLLVFYARNLQLSPTQIGAIFAAGSIGGTLGGVAARRVGERLQPRPVLAGSAMLRGLGLAVLPLAVLAPGIAVPFLVAARFVNAVGWTVWEVHQQTTLQTATPNALRGRVNAAVLFAGRGAETGGSLSGAALAAAFGVLPTLVVGGLGALFSVAWLLAGHATKGREL